MYFPRWKRHLTNKILMIVENVPKILKGEIRGVIFENLSGWNRNLSQPDGFQNGRFEISNDDKTTSKNY